MHVFRVAIAGSLFVHLIVAFVMHSRPVTAATEPKPQHIELITLAKPTPAPQIPKPKTVPQRTSNTAAHRPPTHTVHLTNTNPKGPVAIVAPEPPGTPEPHDFDTPGPDVSAAPAMETPAPPTPKPACSSPDVAARAIDTITPETPDDAAANGVQAKVRVDLDASGAVTRVSVYETSGDQRLDSAAMRAARASRYAPEERNCKDVPGSYLFTVDFQGE